MFPTLTSRKRHVSVVPHTALVIVTKLVLKPFTWTEDSVHPRFTLLRLQAPQLSVKITPRVTRGHQAPCLRPRGRSPFGVCIEMDSFSSCTSTWWNSFAFAQATLPMSKNDPPGLVLLAPQNPARVCEEILSRPKLVKHRSAWASSGIFTTRAQGERRGFHRCLRRCNHRIRLLYLVPNRFRQTHRRQVSHGLESKGRSIAERTNRKQAYLNKSDYYVTATVPRPITPGSTHNGHHGCRRENPTGDGICHERKNTRDCEGIGGHRSGTMLTRRSTSHARRPHWHESQTRAFMHQAHPIPLHSTAPS